MINWIVFAAGFIAFSLWWYDGRRYNPWFLHLVTIVSIIIDNETTAGQMIQSNSFKLTMILIIMTFISLVYKEKD